IVSKLPSGDVTFTVKERGLINIKYKKSNFNIHGLPSDEFPQLSKIKESYSFSIGAGLFSSMLSQTLFAASGSEEKYVLNGALLEVGSSAGEGSNVKLVATDGYRLAKRGAVVNGVDQEFSVIIPSKALQELSRVIASEGGEAVMILASKDQVAFRYKDYYLVSRLIQGQFPDYKRVIPKNLGNKLVMDRKSLLEAAERCSVIASQSANIVRLELKVDGLHIMAQAPDVGSVDEVIEVEVKGKSKAQIAFNVRLLIDSLKAINNEKVSFDVGGPLDPGLIMPVGEDDYVYIVMPIRTQEVATA
ncbi:MAG: DNA polymerase III subunit beta, partial [Candidatus Margulisiibacteriota bacterium]